MLEKIAILDDPIYVKGDGFWHELSKMYPLNKWLKMGEPILDHNGEPIKYDRWRAMWSWGTGYTPKGVKLIDTIDFLEKELSERVEGDPELEAKLMEYYGRLK